MSDAVSREDVLKALSGLSNNTDRGYCNRAIRALPAVQPDDDTLVRHMTKLIAGGLDRIEQLTAERDRLGRELNVAKYGQPDFAWSVHLAAMAGLEADNTRLREALWAILACETPNANATVTRMASITKAALKGDSHEG